MPKANELLAPATGSGGGAVLSGYIMNSVRGQAILINQLMNNVIVFSLFAISGFFLALAIGQYFYQDKSSRKYGSGISFTSSQVTQTVLPFVVANFMLNNTQTQDLQLISNNYVSFMGVAGIIFLVISYVIFHYYVK